MKWTNKVIYQIYPLSFMDSNGDGFGDINGIISKLDYIEGIGVDYIWLSPVMKSPMVDNGYDVASYFEINEIFGTNKDYLDLISKANEKNMGIIMDMIMNHTSDKHEWFEKSKKNIKPYSDYYIWRDMPVKGFGSQFEDEAWTFVKERGQYYLHHFAKEQPDLNWENENVLMEFTNIINYWISKGIKGFRFDVVDMLGKNINEGKTIVIDDAYKKIRQLGEKTWLLHDDVITLGETWSTNRTTASELIAKEDGVFTTAINLRHIFAGWDNDDRWHPNKIEGDYFNEFRDYIYSTHIKFGKKSNIPLFIENHDFPRSISRFLGDDDDLVKKGKVLAATIYGFEGINILYQGQERGMVNGTFDDLEDFNDPETKKFIRNSNDIDILHCSNLGSRDNARKPLMWNNEKNFGFSTSNKTWLTINHKENIDISKSVQILDFYSSIFKIKSEYSEFYKYGKLSMNKYSQSHMMFSYSYHYKNQELIFITNWSSENIIIDINTIITEIYSDIINNELIGHGVFIGIINCGQN